MKEYKNVLKRGDTLQGKSHRYEIKQVLGQGSFGITYLASVYLVGELGAIPTNTEVAIKEFFMSDINGRADKTVTASSQTGLFDKYKQKFIKEAFNLSRLNHPGIVKVLERFETNNTVYYAMEYIPGCNLDDYITHKGQLTELETLQLTDQILDALGHMHSKGMLHLDLKPSNIMMKHGRPVLIDFGLSKQFDNNGQPESSTSIGAGTPGYSPIEQSSFYGSGSQSNSISSTMDIYALGATMFKMLTGRRPPIASEVLNLGFPEEELRAKSVSPKTVNLIKRLMNPMWKQRPQTVAEVKSQFQLPPEVKLKEPPKEPPYMPKNDGSQTILDANFGGPQPPHGGGYGSVTPSFENNDSATSQKERHGCVSAWLWVALVVNALLIIFYGIAMFGMDTREDALGFGLCSIGAAVNVLGALLLLRWNKIGFYMMAICSILAIAINIFVLNMEPVAMIGSLFAVVIWWAILQIKSNGVSAWSQLSSGWEGKKNQTFYWIFGILISLLFVLTLVAFRNAGESTSNYDWDDDEVVEALVEEVEGDDIDAKRLRFLNSMVEATNEGLPMDVEEGVKMTRVFVEGDYVIYILTCDEDVLDIDLLRKSKASMKKVIKENLSANDPDMERELQTMINAEKGVGYRYVGDTSGKSFTIEFPVSELKKL